ncbi:MAG: ectoine synthase [Methanomicrobiales archaeon]
MIVRKMDEIQGTSREVKSDNGNWVSKRILLKEDNMGFSLHETIIYAGTETLIWYKNHLEAVYCVEGEGEIETTNDGKVYSITPGTMYALDQHDRHYLRAYDSDLRLLCVFNPPLVGDEVHDEDGSYRLP